jgi:hypothetical protein
MKKTLLIIFAVLIILEILYVVLKQPKLDRDWTEDAKILPDVTINDKTINVKNLRDWRYKQGETISRNYYEEEFEIDKIQNTYFLLNPFGKWEGVGHAFFLFEFEGNKTVAVSVEARREKDEDFSALMGLFNNFELWYTWGSAADLFTRRAIYHDEDLYLYKLIIKQETSAKLFLELAKQTENLETEPRFYNTLTANCTNILADVSNEINPGSIPWNWARIFTGFSDDKLYELGLISNEKSFKETFEDSRIDLDIKELRDGRETYSREFFWLKLKDLIKK